MYARYERDEKSESPYKTWRGDYDDSMIGDDLIEPQLAPIAFRSSLNVMSSRFRHA